MDCWVYVLSFMTSGKKNIRLILSCAVFARGALYLKMKKQKQRAVIFKQKRAGLCFVIAPKDPGLFPQIAEGFQICLVCTFCKNNKVVVA